MYRGMNVSLAFVLLITACQDPSGPTSPLGSGSTQSVGVVIAVVDGDSWNSGLVDVRRGGGLLHIVATAWPSGDETRQYLQLALQTTVGLEPQTIGPGKPAWASITIEFVAGWLARDTFGSGSITLTSLTAERAVGTFTFSAFADRSFTPAVRQVTKGYFDVRLE